MDRRSSNAIPRFFVALTLILLAFLSLHHPAAAGNMDKTIAQAAKIQDFKDEVLDSKVPVLVDFWAPWCGPCRLYGPILDKVVKSYNGRVKVVRFSVDDTPQLAKIFELESIPATYCFNKGKMVDNWVGLVSEARLHSAIDKMLRK